MCVFVLLYICVCLSYWMYTVCVDMRVFVLLYVLCVLICVCLCYCMFDIVCLILRLFFSSPVCLQIYLQNSKHLIYTVHKGEDTLLIKYMKSLPYARNIHFRGR